MFWPIGVTIDGKKMFTYDPCINGIDALHQFEVWENEYNYHFKDMVIEVRDENNEVERIIEVRRRYVFGNEYFRDLDKDPDNPLGGAE